MNVTSNAKRRADDAAPLDLAFAEDSDPELVDVEKRQHVLGPGIVVLGDQGFELLLEGAAVAHLRLSARGITAPSRTGQGVPLAQQLTGDGQPLL